MVSSQGITLVSTRDWDRGGADHGWSHHNYFINTHRAQIRRCSRECTGAINGKSFIFRHDHSETSAVWHTGAIHHQGYKLWQDHSGVSGETQARGNNTLVRDVHTEHGLR